MDDGDEIERKGDCLFIYFFLSLFNRANKTPPRKL